MKKKPTNQKKQHSKRGLYQKLFIRKMASAVPGPAYVPFIGDGDLAVKCYPGRKIYGCDLNPVRVATARGRLPEATIKIANADTWPFPNLAERIAVADIDAYSNPYPAFRSFWRLAPKESRVLVFLTDSKRSIQSKNKVMPDGSSLLDQSLTTQAARILSRTYVSRTFLPWLEEFVKPYYVADKRVQHFRAMLYIALDLRDPSVYTPTSRQQLGADAFRIR